MARVKKMEDEQEKYKRYAGWFIGGTIVLLLGAIIVARLYGSGGGGGGAHGGREDVAAKCAAVAGVSDTIFVLLPGTTTPQAIYSIYARAMCPYRVFVAVSDNAAYEKILFSSSDLRHVISKNTKRISDPIMAAAAAETDEGVGRVMWNILYRSEMFVAVFSPDMTDITQDWDQVLVDQLRRKTSPHENPRIVLTSKTSLFSHGPLYLYRTGAVIAGRPLHHPVPKHNRVKQMFASYDFIFTYATAFQEVPYYRGPGGPPGDDFVLSMRLWCAGWDFYVPEVCVYHHQEEDLSPRRSPIRATRKKKSAAAADIMTAIKETLDQAPSVRRRTPREFLTGYLGVSSGDFLPALASPRQHTGIVDENDHSEVILKYGSHETYLNQSAATRF